MTIEIVCFIIPIFNPDLGALPLESNALRSQAAG